MKLSVWLAVIVLLLSKLIDAQSASRLYHTARYLAFLYVVLIVFPVIYFCTLPWRSLKSLVNWTRTQDQEPLRPAPIKIRELSYTEVITKKIHVKELPPSEVEGPSQGSVVPEIDVNADGPSLQPAAVIGQE